MEYDQRIEQFCERKIFPNQPEYLNSLSALFIIYISYRDLKNYKNLKNTTILIHASIGINGLAAFLYHWNDWYIFQLFDVYTMIIPLWIGICDIMITLDYKLIYIIGTTFINQIILVLLIFPNFEKYFVLIFASEMIMFIPLYKQSLHLPIQIERKEKSKKGLKGIIICLVSGITWMLTEQNCNKYMILGHPIWHIGMSIGLSNLIEYFNGIKNKN